ncbi:hypothetical protein Sm713_58780 [Streptomyces sp. TS71-3]|nr:hypothetical protein Sm713_58780 [Streptomyces sp. TS71-3]
MDTLSQGWRITDVYYGPIGLKEHAAGPPCECTPWASRHGRPERVVATRDARLGYRDMDVRRGFREAVVRVEACAPRTSRTLRVIESLMRTVGALGRQDGTAAVAARTHPDAQGACTAERSGREGPAESPGRRLTGPTTGRRERPESDHRGRRGGARCGA